jgi:hypothetical protein
MYQMSQYIGVFFNFVVLWMTEVIILFMFNFFYEVQGLEEKLLLVNVSAHVPNSTISEINLFCM